MCVCVCVCVNVTSQNNVIVATCKTTSRIILRNVTKFQKFINCEFKKFITYTRHKTLSARNVVPFQKCVRLVKYFVGECSCWKESDGKFVTFFAGKFSLISE